MKVIAGVYQTAPGASTDYFGESVASPTPQLARRKGVAVIWQDLALFPEMTVAENIAFDGLVGAPRLVNYRAIRETARAALAKLGVELDLSAPLKSLPISGRQLVAIARALASDAKLVFMDEPTASLTQTETDHVLAVVRTLSASGVAVVFVSHRLAEVLDVSSRVTVLRDGRLVGVFDAAGMTQSRLTELMTGKRFDQAVTARDVGDAPIVVDPVMVAESGAVLLDDEARTALVERLLPLATVVTPNIPEARALSGAEEHHSQEELAREVLALGPRAVVVTGGHSAGVVDVYFDGSEAAAIEGERHPGGASHGSGCTHSSALAAFLARGETPLAAAREARRIASAAVAAGLRDIGRGPGPVDVFDLTSRFQA
ncbi:MAG TPA: PfkB family carbohydrate kinase [Thermoleophilaceae bacterium]